MIKNIGFPIRVEWTKFYFFLEGLMRTGKCNRWAMHIYLAEYYGCSEELAKLITENWMYNYEELSAKFGWHPVVEEPKKEPRKTRSRKSNKVCATV